MDTTKTYFKMCGKAFPQDAEEGHFLKTQDQLQEMIIHLWGHVEVQRKGESPKPYIVPPRALLDYFYTVTCPQITVGTSQVMNNKDLVPQYEKEKAEHQYWSQFTSMEQLWLAFTMKVMYGKIWNGEDWVK